MMGKTCFAQVLRRAMLGTALAVCIPMGALQAEAAEIDDAVEVVRMFFAEHSRRFNNNEEPLLNDGKASRRFLVDGLAHDDLQGALMFDPVYGGQDADIANLNIAPDADAPILRGAAQIHVTFTNMGAPRNFIYTLIEAPDGTWQINDIYSEDDNWSLSELVQGQGFEIRSDPVMEATLSGGGLPAPDRAETAGQRVRALTTGLPSCRAWKRETCRAMVWPKAAVIFFSFWTVQAPCGGRSTVWRRSPRRDRFCRV